MPLKVLDLPVYLGSYPRGVHGLELVGVLFGEVDPPEPFRTMGLASKFDAFVGLDLVGVRTKSDDYFVRGKLLSVVPRTILEAAKKKSSGRMALVLSGDAVKLSNVKDGVQNFITMLKWVKGSYNSWQFRAVNARPLYKDEFPDFFEVIVNAYKQGWVFSYPVEFPSGYTDACAGHDFVVLGGSTSSDQPEVIQPPGWGLSNSTPVPPAASVPIVAPETLSGASVNLGGSSKSNVDELLSNRASTHEDIKFAKKNKVENRFNLAPRSEVADMVEDVLRSSEEKVADVIKKLSEYQKAGNVMENALKYTAGAVKRAWDRKVGSFTGRALLKRAIESVLPDYDVRSNSGGTIISDNLDILGPSICDEWVQLSSDNAENKFLSDFYTNRFKVYFKIIEILLGIRDKLVDSVDVCSEQAIDMLAVLQDNPYYLCFIDPRVSTEELDKLAMLYGVSLQDPEVRRIRNVAYMHNFMLDTNNIVLSESTVVPYSKLLRSVRSGYIFSKNVVNTLQVEGYLVSYERLESLKYYIRSNMDYNNFVLPRTGWISTKTKEILPIEGSSPSKIIQDYISSGLGLLLRLKGTEYVSDYILAKKEMYIYNRLRELCEYNPYEVPKDKIAAAVSTFEDKKRKELGIPDFKLEQQQVNAVYLVGSGHRVACLTGPAGSGKTTAAEAMEFGLEYFLGVPVESIYFCAPTGKAANRLKEVVKRRTRTINSLFMIGGEGVSIKNEEDIKKRDEIKALIVDESSMPNIHLLYELLLRVQDGTYIFFLGDKEQLSPIGFGKPFATMLTYLPTVVLNVSKRASDSSGITKNAKKIIYESDGVITDLDDYPDFRIIDEKDENKVVNLVCAIVDYHLGKRPAQGFRPVEPRDSQGNLLFTNNLSPDDIQIITPINGQAWGTISLNRMTHDSFNPRLPHEPAIAWLRGKDDVVEFRLRDRVIHISANQSKRTRLIQCGPTSFVWQRDANGEKVTGIFNGEVGKIIGFFNATELDFDHAESSSEKEDLKSEFKGTENTLFVAVEYTDVDLDNSEPVKFVILYRTEILNRNPNGVIDVVSSDLRYLDLANALTVHRLQGSQAKLCICVFLPVGGPYSKFISRNMIYTSPTRAQQAVYMVGDILGPESCVNRGRRIQESDERESIIDFF